MTVDDGQLSPNRYHDRHFDVEAVKILPGEYFVTNREMLIVTVLGSCVSACLRDPYTGVAGMNHFMLPGNPDQQSPLAFSARYGVHAMEMLINTMLKQGARRDRLEAKLFGAGNVLRGLTLNKVGTRNAEFALDYLHTENIPVLAEDLLGELPRKVYFFTGEGRVLVRKLRNMHNTTIIDRELEYSSRLRQTQATGDVDLFS